MFATEKHLSVITREHNRNVSCMKLARYTCRMHLRNCWIIPHNSSFSARLVHQTMLSSVSFIINKILKSFFFFFKDHFENICLNLKCFSNYKNYIIIFSHGLYKFISKFLTFKYILEEKCCNLWGFMDLIIKFIAFYVNFTLHVNSSAVINSFLK